MVNPNRTYHRKQRIYTLEQETEGISAQMAGIPQEFLLKQRIVALEQEKSDAELSSLEVLTAKMVSLEAFLQSSQLACQERDELKLRVMTLEKEKSGVTMDLSILKKEFAQLKSKVSDVNKNCETSIAHLKKQVSLCTTQGPMMKPVKQYAWKCTKDVCVSGVTSLEPLECPPMASGVHKWSILVEERASGEFIGLGVLSTVHNLKKNVMLDCQEGGWAYRSNGLAMHKKRLVKQKESLPNFKKGSKVTFVLDLTGEGTLSASVDGKSFKLFSDMISEVRDVNKNNPNGGFVPAVSLSESADKVQFLGFESA